VLSALTDAGLAIVDVSTRDPDLEDVFLSLTSSVQPDSPPAGVRG